jgi:hypothetical protein
MLQLVEYTTKIRNQISKDEKFFLHNKELYERKGKTSRGKLFWDTHPANELLHHDLKSGNNKKRSELQKARTEFGDFSPVDFRKHVHQNHHKQLTGPYWKEKRNKKARKQLDDEMDSIKEEWGFRQD